MQVKRFSVSLEEDLFRDLDEMVERNRFPNRSRAIGYLIRKYVVDEQWGDNREVAGAIVLVYDHHKRELQSHSTDVQHEFHDLILSVQHVHLDHSNCLETIAVKGLAGDLKRLADRLIAIKGVKHGQLVMTVKD
ncbi:MAG: nickel-responsive transcriptional regulator NikR [Bacteroidales bacterium]|nr:nickel-responsive transcriptional regulator NikR [Bacteroidales bacterium]